MAITVKHRKVSSIEDDPAAVAAGQVVPSDWNDDHDLSGVGTMATQDASSVSITGGTVGGQDVVGFGQTVIFSKLNLMGL